VIATVAAPTIVKEPEKLLRRQLRVQKQLQMEKRLKKGNRQPLRIMLKSLKLKRIKKKQLQRKNNLFYNLKNNL